MKKRVVFLIFITALFSDGVFSQSAEPAAAPPVIKDATGGAAPEDFTTGDVRGAVNTTAVYLPKPVYPAGARRSGAEGAVRVRITIDEEGNVEAAQAISGDALLGASAEDAARRSKFRIKRDGKGNAVKIQGVLVYSFVARKAGWSRIAYHLGLLDRLPAASFPIPAAKKAFAPEWTGELQMLEKLDEIRRSEPEPPTSPFADAAPVFRNSTSGPPDGRAQVSSTLTRRLMLPPRPSAEQVALAQNLISALRSRLGNDELSLWQFNLGLNLTGAFWSYRNRSDRDAAAQSFRQFAEQAPAGAAEEVLAAVKNLAVIFGRGTRTVDTDEEIRELVAVILNVK